MHRKPYNPAAAGPQVHDRRATQVNRGLAAHLAVVDDPFECGARIATVRSIRDDPLGDRFARGHIDEAQFTAGREFQRIFMIAERGPLSMQLAERIDGGLLVENVTDAQLAAGRQLSRCYRRLGADGSTLIHDGLIRNMSMKQIAEARGLAGQKFEAYFGLRLREALAIVLGFVNRLFAFLTVTIRADHVVAGLAMVLFGDGLSSFARHQFVGIDVGQNIPAMALPVVSDIPALGPIFLRQNALVYLSYFMVAAVWYFLYRTRPGLALRAAGEKPIGRRSHLRRVP